jgi:hypothetical protein
MHVPRADADGVPPPPPASQRVMRGGNALTAPTHRSIAAVGIFFTHGVISENAGPFFKD